MALRVEREQLKLLLVIGVLSVCVYGSWRGAQWFETHYENPLSAAVMSQDYEEARRLVEMGANTNEDGGSPLMVVVGSGNLEFAQYLLDNGADINARQQTWFPRFSVLEQSAAGGRSDLVVWLVERGAEYTVVAAALLNDLETVKQALEMNPTLLARMNIEGYPLLHLTVRGGDVELAEFLLEAGADPNKVLRSPFASNNYSARRFAEIWEQEALLDLFDERDSKAIPDMPPILIRLNIIWTRLFRVPEL